MPKISGDFWRHLGMQVFAAAALAALASLSKVDWSALGAYGLIVPMGVQMLTAIATEAFNQALATPIPAASGASAASPSPAGRSGPVGRALLFAALVVGVAALGSPHVAHAATAAKVSASAASVPAGTNALQAWIQQLFAGPEQFTLADLQAALADANAQTPPDTDHGQCWQALIPVVQTNVPSLLPSGLGAAQLIQKGFDDQNLVNGTGTTITGLKKACAMTIVDMGTTLNSLLLKIGVAALPIPKL